MYEDWEDLEELRRKALDVLSLMRGDGMPLAEAARLVGIKPADVHREVGSALEKRGSRWRAKAWDRLPRFVRFLDVRGLTEVEVRDSRTASRVASWWNAVDRFLRTGDDRALRPFRRKSFASRGVRYPFITDPEVLQILALVGEVSFEDLYAHVD